MTLKFKIILCHNLLFAFSVLDRPLAEHMVGIVRLTYSSICCILGVFSVHVFAYQ